MPRCRPVRLQSPGGPSLSACSVKEFGDWPRDAPLRLGIGPADTSGVEAVRGYLEGYEDRSREVGEVPADG
jgi:hypothetical protein